MACGSAVPNNLTFLTSLGLLRLPNWIRGLLGLWIHIPSPPDWPLVLDRVANYRSAPYGDGFTPGDRVPVSIRSPDGLRVFNPGSFGG